MIKLKQSSFVKNILCVKFTLQILLLFQYSDNKKNSLREKYGVTPKKEFVLVRTFLYSDQKKTLYLDTFHAVIFKATVVSHYQIIRWNLSNIATVQKNWFLIIFFWILNRSSLVNQKLIVTGIREWSVWIYQLYQNIKMK